MTPVLLYAPVPASLTLRRESDGSRVVSGRFPYNSAATLSDGGQSGRPQKERFAPRAFRYRVERPTEDIHLLFGHDFGKPLASKRSGTLQLNDTDAALEFEARIAPEVADTTHGRDVLALISAGLAVGLSPGFRIPPKRVSPNAESVAEEDPRLGNAIIRTIHDALLYELSIVTRPAYDETQVEARSWHRTERLMLADRLAERWRRWM